MALTRSDIEKVALLARLELTEQELETITSQLGHVVSYVETLAELDTENVEPLAHAVETRNVFRDDEVRSSLTSKEALANAPSADGEFYLVPAVLG